mgnify:CR=1 FL=1
MRSALSAGVGSHVEVVALGTLFAHPGRAQFAVVDTLGALASLHIVAVHADRALGGGLAGQTAHWTGSTFRPSTPGQISTVTLYACVALVLCTVSYLGGLLAESACE